MTFSQFTEIGMTQQQLDDLLDKVEKDIFPKVNVAYLALSKLIKTTQPDPFSCNCSSAAMNVLNVLIAMKGDNVADVIEGVSLQDNNIYMQEANIIDYWNRINTTTTPPNVNGFTVTYTPPSTENDSKLTFTKGDQVVVVNDGILVGGRSYTLNVIKKEVLVMKTPLLVNQTYPNLVAPHKLILDLPEIMWKLGRKNAAICMLHWLEGRFNEQTQKNENEALNFDFNWVISYQRAKDALNTAYQKLSTINNSSGTTINSIDLFNLTTDNDTKCESCATSHAKAKELFKTYPANKAMKFGDFNYNAQDASKEPLNMIQTEKIGSPNGDNDDLGMAWGRTSLRQYISGIAIKKSDANGEYVELTVDNIGVRFIDSYDFQDCSWYGCNPFNNQPLGVWLHNVSNPQLPLMSKSEYLNPPYGWIPMNDKYFYDFKKKENVGLGADYNSYTDFRFWNNNISTKNPITKKVIFRLP